MSFIYFDSKHFFFCFQIVFVLLSIALLVLMIFFCEISRWQQTIAWNVWKNRIVALLAFCFIIMFRYDWYEYETKWTLEIEKQYAYAYKTAEVYFQVEVYDEMVPSGNEDFFFFFFQKLSALLLYMCTFKDAFLTLDILNFLVTYNSVYNYKWNVRIHTFLIIFWQ